MVIHTRGFQAEIIFSLSYDYKHHIRGSSCSQGRPIAYCGLYGLGYTSWLQITKPLLLG